MAEFEGEKSGDHKWKWTLDSFPCHPYLRSISWWIYPTTSNLSIYLPIILIIVPIKTNKILNECRLISLR